MASMMASCIQYTDDVPWITDATKKLDAAYWFSLHAIDHYDQAGIRAGTLVGAIVDALVAWETDARAKVEDALTPYRAATNLAAKYRLMAAEQLQEARHWRGQLRDLGLTNADIARATPMPSWAQRTVRHVA